MTFPSNQPAEPSTGVLLLRFTEQVTALLKAEIALAKLEIAAKGKRLGQGAGMVVVAAFLAIFGVAALLVTAGLALALVVDGWLAGLIVAGSIFLLAALLAIMGIKNVRRGGSPVPTAAIDGAKKDLAAVKGHDR